MICRKCGLPQSDDAIFCEDCGAKLPDRPAETVFPPHLYGVKQPEKRSATAYVLLFLVSMIVFAAVVIFLITSLYNDGYRGGKSDDTITEAVSLESPTRSQVVSRVKPAIFDAAASLFASPDSSEPILVQSVFSAESPQIYITFAVEDAPAGSLIKVDLMYGETVMNVWASVSDGTLQKMQCSFIKPSGGWKVGVYEVKISARSEYLASVIFFIK
ncbi:MAG: hypothetical protein ACYCYI_03300 [Saccharofermentanales bacterium]